MHRNVLVPVIALLSVIVADSAMAQSGDSEYIRMVATLQCEQIECRCALEQSMSSGTQLFTPNDEEGCQLVGCRCVEPPAEGEADRDRLLPPPRPPVEHRERVPAPLGGALLERRHVGFRLDTGFPFLDFRIGYGAHDILELSVGYRSFWGLTHAGYGQIRFRLYNNRENGHALLSLGLLGGFNYVGGGRDHPFRTRFTAGDSGFGEINLGLSIGRHVHSFTAELGARLGWVQEDDDCEEDEWGWSECWDSIYENGEAGLLVTPYIELGYAARFHRNVSFFISTGFEAYTNTDQVVASVRQKLGIIVDF